MWLVSHLISVLLFSSLLFSSLLPSFFLCSDAATWMASAALSVVGFGCGALASRALGLDPLTCLTIGLEVGVQNTILSITIAFVTFADSSSKVRGARARDDEAAPWSLRWSWPCSALCAPPSASTYDYDSPLPASSLWAAAPRSSPLAALSQFHGRCATRPWSSL